jgi:hypothetical protein
MTATYKNATAAFLVVLICAVALSGQAPPAIKEQQTNLLALNATIEAAHW